jgi:hypothetical protein
MRGAIPPFPQYALPLPLGAYARRWTAEFHPLSASVEEREKVDSFLCLAELKSYIHVRRKFNQVYPNQAAPIYRFMMYWDKCLKETGKFAVPTWTATPCGVIGQ